MKLRNITRSITIIALAIVAVLPGMNTSAAIPCQELPVIEPDPNMVVPLIYIELPVPVEGALNGSQPADRTGATELEGEVAGQVTSAADNQFRCLGYGNDTVFVGNSTPQHRVQMFARPAVEEEISQYIQLESLYIERLGEPIQLTDGRYLIDFGIIVNSRDYLTGEFIFTQESDGLYLDGSSVEDSVKLNTEATVEKLSLNSTREVKTIEATDGDRIVFDNTEEEASANIVITDEDGETIFEGNSMAVGMVGGADRDIFVVHDLEPGEYQITVTFDQDNITYGITLVVSNDGMATPEASPAS